ncbi:MAG: DUF899 domain-containing protein [Proteobacteria bacterium]|nr:DUF899 domain-containing protein [Pseudomonadota bacterium]
MTPRVVTHEEWLKAHRAHLAKEKAFTRQRDELARERRALPWERVEKDYVFEVPEGRVTLADLFAGRSQLLVQHFMFGPDWNEGCPSCSFWSDNFNGVDTHLAHRDTSFVLVSRAPIARLEAYRKRMGWTLRWVSSLGSDFNFDYGVSFKPGEAGLKYNHATIPPYGEETPGLSAFRRGEDGAIYRTYSTFARGLDMLNGAYHLLDMTSKGRDEEGLPFSMAWVRRHDQY